MLINLVDNLKTLSINTPTVNMAAFGDIVLFDDKATIKYPYVNIDILTTSVVNYSKTYTFRIYVCDRNEPYVAYNKTELILDNILKNSELDIKNYVTNFFNLDFKDLVHGVYADITIEDKLITKCFTEPFTEVGYILMENGDLIRIEE